MLMLMGGRIDSRNCLPLVAFSGPVARLKRDSRRRFRPRSFNGSSAGGEIYLVEKAAFAVRQEPSRHRRHSGHEVNYMVHTVLVPSKASVNLSQDGMARAITIDPNDRSPCLGYTIML